MGDRELTLTGGGPWGFTLSGGKDFGAPLKVSKLTPGGKAVKAGMKFNDYITEINGDPTESLLHSDAMMLIKTTGVTLHLKLSKDPPKSPQIQPRYIHEEEIDHAGPPAGNRPQPPPVPANVTPPKPSYTSSATIRTNAPVQMKSAVAPEPKAQPSQMVPDSGLDTGSSSTQQSPAFKRITVEDTPTPSVLSRPPPPPTAQMQHVTIEDANVIKTSQRPQPPSSSPGKVSTTTFQVAKGSPVAKPPPPATVTGATSPPVTSPGGTKMVDRQGVCEACNQPIRGPFASAMGRVWHPEHFVCAGCNTALQNTMFVYEEEKIYCEPCYQKTYAQTCHGCHKPIVGPCISAVGLHWHQEHFRCSRCNSDLTKGEGFNMENNMLFCADCFGAVYGATCFGCGQKIGGNELWVEAMEHQWHSNCFVCNSCRRRLEGATFFAKLGRPYCKDCSA